MKTTQVISKYLNRRIEKLKERGESTNVPKHFLELAELSDIEAKRLDTDEYDIALNFTPERYSRRPNSTLGKFAGKPSYIIRRKEDNHVISGYIKDMGLNIPVNSLSRDSSGRYMNHSEYESIDSEGFFALMQQDARLKAFLDGVAIDDYTAEDLSPTGINTITGFNNIHSPSVNGQALVLDDADFNDVSSRQYSHIIEYNAKANSPSDTLSISIPMQAAKNSASWYQIHNLVEPEDFDSFRNELTEAVENDIDAVAVDLYYEFIKHGLPESITEDDLKGRKYTQSELNFIRAKKDESSPDSPLYRHQYIDRMRSYFDVTHQEHYSLTTVNCLKNAGFRVADSQWGVDWSLHTFLMRDHNQMLQPITPEKVQAISNGRIPSNEFVQGMGVKGTNRKTFDKFMKIIGANVIYNRSTKELLSLSALPKELLDPEDFVKHRKDRDHSFSDMWRTISPYLINHASKLTEAQDEYQNNPSPEGKVKIKELSAKYKWLSQGGDKLKNFNSLQEKLKGGTLRDYGTILNQYLQAVTQRVAKELSTDPDEIFSIDLEEGNTEVVSLDVSALWEQHLSNTEEELKEHHVKNYAYTLLSDFIAENNLSSELVFEGLESDVAKEEIDLTSYNSDSDRIISNLSKHYPDIDDLESEVYSMTEIVNDNEQYFDVREMFEEPSELDGTDLFKHIQSKAADYRHILELNEDAHVLQTQYQRDLSEFGRDGDFSWTPFFEGERDLGNGLKITAISSKNRLLDEATTQQHCVFSYLQKAMCGEAIILSVTKGDERVATVEISHDDFEDFEIEQCYGKNNEAVGVVIDNAVSEFVETLNEDPDALDIEIPDEITAQIDLDEAESTPSKYASRLSQIPFETDAAHKAYFILEEMTPDEFNVDSFFEHNSWGELLYSSEFYKEIREIRDIANEFKEDNITPHDVLDIKHSQGTIFNPEAIREAIISNIAPTMTFEDKLSQQLKEATQEQTPNNPQHDTRQQQAMRL